VIYGPGLVNEGAPAHSGEGIAPARIDMIAPILRLGPYPVQWPGGRCFLCRDPWGDVRTVWMRVRSLGERKSGSETNGAHPAARMLKRFGGKPVPKRLVSGTSKKRHSLSAVGGFNRKLYNIEHFVPLATMLGLLLGCALAPASGTDLVHFILGPEKRATSRGRASTIIPW